jgi:hypothetical protein
MIVEVRACRIRPGRRARFLELLAQRTVPLLPHGFINELAGRMS